MGKDFEFLGSTLTIPDERVQYNIVRKKFVRLADLLSLEFEKIYKNENKSLDDVAKYGYQQGSDCIAFAITQAVEFLIHNGIHDIDQRCFIEEYYSQYHTWDDDFNEINDRYMEIVLDQEQLDAYRVARRQSRGRLVGGGFGLEGAAKGIVTAGAVNLAFGAVHGVFNGIGKMFSSIAAANKKSKVFNDPATLKHLSTGVYMAVFNIHSALIDALEEKTNIGINGYVYDDELNKATSIFNNIRNHSIDDSMQLKLLKEIIELNPYKPDYYLYILKKFGDEEGKVEAVADYFDIKLDFFKESLIKEVYDGLSLNNEENALRSRDILCEKVKFYKVKDSSRFLDPINKVISEFDAYAKTFDGIQFDSREEAEMAKLEKKHLDGEFVTLDSMDENSLKALKTKISDKNNYKTKVKDNYIIRIEQKLAQLDVEAKTFKGVTYETRSEAALAIEEKEKLDVLFKDVKTMDEASLLALRNRVNSEFRTQIVNSYNDRIDHSLSTLKMVREDETLKELFASVDMNNESSVRQMKDKINKEFTTPSKQQYINELQKRIAIFDEKNNDEKQIMKGKLDLARKYQNRDKHGCLMTLFLYALGIVFSLFLIGWLNIIGLVIATFGYIGHFYNVAEMRKCKKAWKLLTDNGQKPLPAKL